MLTATEVEQVAKKSGITHLLSLAVEERLPKQREAIYSYFLSEIDPVSKQLKTAESELLNNQITIRKKGSLTLVMEEKNEAAFAHILDRADSRRKQ